MNLPLQVTHLGLYDRLANGFQSNYSLGLWSESGDLMTSAEMPTGSPAPHIRGFRYVSVGGPIGSSGQPVLLPGEVYTVGYFAPNLAPDDHAIHFDGFHELNPLFNQVGGAFRAAVEDEMTMPDEPFFADFPQWIGPGFRFVVVPAPGSGAVLVIAMLVGRSCRCAG